MEELPIGLVVAIAGFVAGMIFGATVKITNFCTMGAISDMILMEDKGRFRAYMLSIAVAIIGTQFLHGAELIDVGEATFQNPNFNWLGYVFGGLLFGLGMTMTSGCASRTVVLIGGGNLKSVVVFLVMAVVAFTTNQGLLGVLRANVIDPTAIDLTEMGLETQGIPAMLAAATGVDGTVAGAIVAAVAAGGLLVFCFKDAEFRRPNANLASGLILGALVVAGWWITGVFGYDDFEPTPLRSFSFVGPSANSVMYIMTFTGSTINFGIAALGGVIFGSFLASVFTKTFAIQTFQGSRDMNTHLIGAVLMGFGGTIAAGCTVGQGVTGMSTLALGSLLTLASIIVGGIYGIRYLEEESLGGALAAMFGRG